MILSFFIQALIPQLDAFNPALFEDNLFGCKAGVYFNTELVCDPRQPIHELAYGQRIGVLVLEGRWDEDVWNPKSRVASC